MKEVLEYIQLIPEFKPIVQQVIQGLKEYENEWNNLVDFYVNNAVKYRSAIYKGFIAEGFNESTALALTSCMIQDFLRAIEKVSAVKADSAKTK